MENSSKELIPGKWYKDPTWVVTEGIRVTAITQKGIEVRERIYNKNYTKLKENVSSFFYPISDRYVELTDEELAKYLPKERQNKVLMPRYLKLLDGFDSHHVNEIFDTDEPVPRYTNWTPTWTWKELITGIHKRYFEPATEDEFTIFKYKKKFPKEGSCDYNTEIHQFLKFIFPYRDQKFTGKKFICWGYTGFWEAEDSSKERFSVEYLITRISEILKPTSTASFPTIGYCLELDDEIITYLNTILPKGSHVFSPTALIWTSKAWWKGTLKHAEQNSYAKYTVEQLKQFINSKTKNNEVFREKTTDSRTTGVGTVAIRSRRQQVAVGSRLTGNPTSVKSRKNTIRTAKICKNIIKC